MKVAFYTLGCKVNQYESQAMSETLAKNGYEIVGSDENADIFIVNSCTVTAVADKKTRQSVRHFKRNNPDSIVVLTGCMPQAYPDDADKLIEADIVIGNKNNNKLLDMLDTYVKFGKRVVSINEHEKGDKFSSTSISSFDERTRAYLKIQDGCNRFCSYCIIPTSRGRVRSKPLDELKTEVEQLASNGFAEIVLVGINLSSYGSDIGTDFPTAVETACSVDGIKRVRLGSLEPDHLTDEVIDRLAKCKKLCPQFHISLQSGCNKTLKAMNRHYTSEEYETLCNKLRSSFKDCTLTTDVMVGFAGETDEDFEESLKFVKKIGFESVHVFPYSIRTGTRAEKMSGHNPKSVKEKRCGIMLAETEKIRLAFYNSLIGKIQSVLFESSTADGFVRGHTANYTPVKVKSPQAVCGEIMDVKIIEIADDICIGELV
ncbi:MAG: tRNA (N(6)-L-threonylcarbamoyladenosine(37)-C(2))-methylthiotransferase MtaB [Faecalibacterium sp.]|nr:tRNA (N(6)-L-threonylcarbamoyladenosine(37)-C(2))-methylthiotransferase MtaB [Ruminococcus sp.]MCM1484965.1 tRNA (N(6)-L-threonylcarbamoyladenosine(37)-C(2))-methylthiotransferase MtaB [Faecalibacterium sp.]